MIKVIKQNSTGSTLQKTPTAILLLHYGVLEFQTLGHLTILISTDHEGICDLWSYPMVYTAKTMLSKQL
jgi:hypothetical protein